jgi:hypothetical protein
VDHGQAGSSPKLRFGGNSGIDGAYGGRVQIRTKVCIAGYSTPLDEAAEFARDWFLLSID